MKVLFFAFSFQPMFIFGFSQAYLRNLSVYQSNTEYQGHHITGPDVLAWLGLKPRCRHNALWTLDRGELRGGSGGFRQGRAFSMTQRESSCSVPAPDKEAFEMFVFFFTFFRSLKCLC